MLEVIKVAETQPMQNPHGVSATRLLDREYAQAVHLSLAPGQGLKRHATPTDVFFYVLEGRGIVEVGGEKVDVSADSLVESPANLPHRLENNGDSVFRVLVVKAPRPTGPTVFLE